MRIPYRNLHRSARWLYLSELSKVASGVGSRSLSSGTTPPSDIDPQSFQIYNSLTKRKDVLQLRTEKLVTWYSCGPTVYDDSHLGHAVCFTRFDLIRRVLEQRGFTVVYAMNITDVDDKIIRKANELNLNFREVAQRFESSFFQDLNALNIRFPSIVLRATDHIEEMVDFIQELLRTGYAYPTSEGILFDTSRDPAYPRFRQHEVDNSARGQKKNVRDFNLWKVAKPGEPLWETPFGPGRPGWHVECSAMASKVFGNHIDIHSGGRDLEFPHHENEEAQCCAYHQKPNWAKHYIHSGFVRLSGEKMSKSLGNVVTVKDFLKNHSPEELRMICARFPYAMEIDFSDKQIGEAKASLTKLKEVLSLSDEYLRGRFTAEVNQNELFLELESVRRSVEEALRDNFNFAKATGNVLTMVHTLGTQLSKLHGSRRASGLSAVASVRNFILEYFNDLGFRLDLKDSAAAGDGRFDRILDEAVDFRFEVKRIALNSTGIDKRKELLNCCDNFRDALRQERIAIKDRPDRSSWSVSS